MKRNLIFAVVLLGVGTGAYYLGWYRGFSQDAAMTSLARGGVALVTARMLREKDTPTALKLLESTLRMDLATLGALKSHVPKGHAGDLENFLTKAEKYQKQFPDSQKPAQE